MTLLARETQQVGERIRYSVSCDEWLNEGEVLTGVTPTVDSGTAVCDGLVIGADRRSFSYFVSNVPLGDQFNVIFAQATSFGQTHYGHVQFTGVTNGGPTSSSGNGALIQSIVGATGPAGPTGPAFTYVLPSGGDDTANIQAAMTISRGSVRLRGAYTCNSPLAIPSNITLDGEGTATITCGNFRAFTMSGATNAHLLGIAFDLTNAPGSSGFVGIIQNSTGCEVDGCTFTNPKGEIYLSAGSSQCRVTRNVITGSLSRSVHLDGVAYNVVSENVIYNGVSFGIFLENAAHHNLIYGNRTILNGIELIGIKYDCYSNRVIGNHAEHCGDNGISITGQFNTVVGNNCKYNAFNGIGVYGSHNSITGNTCIGNGQAVGNYAGILIQSAFGGTGQFNTVVGNTTDDDQAVMTQRWGINLTGASNYVLWSPGLVVTAATYCSNGSNIYYAANGGTTGATPPTHTAGTVSDGGVLWTYITTWENATREPIGCEVGPNADDRSITGIHVNDTTVNNYNGVVTREYDRRASVGQAQGQRFDVNGIVRHFAPWGSGNAYGYGNTIYTSGGNSYRCSNVGGIASVEPTHIVGTVTGADGIAWTLLGVNVREYTTVKTANSQVTVDSVFGLGQINAPGTFTLMLAGAGDPNGVVSAPKGSVFLRSDGGVGTTFYVRESATLTVWTAK